jgi:hypothetical protein
MKIKTSTGIELDSEEAMAPSLTQYAKSRNVENAIVFLSNDKGKKSYLLTIAGKPEFESYQAEAVAAHIDILAVSKLF